MGPSTELLAFTDVIRILETAAQAAIVTDEDATYLVESYKAFRAEAHLSTQIGPHARTAPSQPRAAPFAGSGND